MTYAEFHQLTRGMKAESLKACALVLVEGRSINGAAKDLKLAPSTVLRMLRKIPKSVCPVCGQASRV